MMDKNWSRSRHELQKYDYKVKFTRCGKSRHFDRLCDAFTFFRSEEGGRLRYFEKDTEFFSKYFTGYTTLKLFCNNRLIQDRTDIYSKLTKTILLKTENGQIYNSIKDGKFVCHYNKSINKNGDIFIFVKNNKKKWFYVKNGIICE